MNIFRARVVSVKRMGKGWEKPWKSDAFLMGFYLEKHCGLKWNDVFFLPINTSQ